MFDDKINQTAYSKEGFYFWVVCWLPCHAVARTVQLFTCTPLYICSPLILLSNTIFRYMYVTVLSVAFSQITVNLNTMSVELLLAVMTVPTL